jgi:hypothetical protein
MYEHRPGASFGTLRSLIGWARLKGIKGVILDYLQLVGGKKANETEEYHRYTLYANAGTESAPALWLRSPGPHFSTEPPPFQQWTAA